MDGERAPRWPGIVLAVAVGPGSLALLLWGTVTVGAGDSKGFERTAREILRAADRTLAATGWSDGWRAAAWVCGAAALVAAVLLVWAAAGVRDEPPHAVALANAGGGEMARADDDPPTTIRAAASGGANGPARDA